MKELVTSCTFVSDGHSCATPKQGDSYCIHPGLFYLVTDPFCRLGTSVRMESGVPRMTAEGRPYESTVLSWAHHLTAGYLGSIRGKMVFI